ncbi:protein of unknown function [Methylococcus capsulatus]|uniref:Uncharacterized protein n=1 Tax=Methylococcus capsulatus TaxID=414 RepID=A0AA35Y117_METCP|nr:protein of unknown function [Methylococcus capsulatus]
MLRWQGPVLGTRWAVLIFAGAAHDDGAGRVSHELGAAQLRRVRLRRGRFRQWFRRQGDYPSCCGCSAVRDMVYPHGQTGLTGLDRPP